MNAIYWIVNLIGATGGGVLLIRVTKQSKDWVTFAHFFSFVWFFILLASQVLLNGAIRPQETTLIVLYVAWWVFLVGALFRLENRETTTASAQVVSLTRGRMVLFAIILLQMIAIYLEINLLDITLSDYLGGLSTLLPELRLSGILLQLDLPWYLQIWRWGYVYYIPLAFLLYSQKHISRFVFIAVLLLGLISTPSMFTRSPIIQFIIISYISWVTILKPKFSRQIVLGAIFLLSSMFLFVAMQQIIAGSARSTNLNEQLAAYFGGSAKAYETILLGQYPREAGFYSLDMINFPLNRLGIIESYPGLTRPFVYTPVSTNIYTYLDAFTLDWGVIGALLGSFFLGLIIAWLYNRVYKAPTYSNVVIYGYAVYACAMSPINNEFIRFGMLLVILISWGLGKFIEASPSRRRVRSQVHYQPQPIGK